MIHTKNGQHVSWFRPSIVGSIFVVTSIFIVISNSFFGWFLDSFSHHFHSWNGQIFTLIGYILTLISFIVIGPIYPITSFLQANILLILLAQSLLGISFSIHLISSFTQSFSEALYVNHFVNNTKLLYQLPPFSSLNFPSFRLISHLSFLSLSSSCVYLFIVIPSSSHVTEWQSDVSKNNPLFATWTPSLAFWYFFFLKLLDFSLRFLFQHFSRRFLQHFSRRFLQRFSTHFLFPSLPTRKSGFPDDLSTSASISSLFQSACALGSVFN